jgi:hypothetical protein
MLKVQSIQASLGHIDESKIPDHEEIENCLNNAGKSFRLALRETFQGRRIDLHKD